MNKRSPNDPPSGAETVIVGVSSPKLRLPLGQSASRLETVATAFDLEEGDWRT